MSLLSINRLKVVVTKQAVYAECKSGLLKPQVRFEKVMLTADDAESVRNAIRQVCAPFANLQMWRCAIYFADTHVHYVVLPKVDLQLSYAEKMDYARSMLINYWGDAAKNWPLRLQDHLHNQSTLVSCIPCLETLDIRTLFASMRPLVIQVQPYSTYLLTHLQKRPSNGYVMVLEPNAIRLFLLQDDVCEYISTQALQTPSVAELVHWLQRIRELHQDQHKVCYLVTESTQKASMNKVVSFKNALHQALNAGGVKLVHMQTQQSLMSNIQGGFHV